MTEAARAKVAMRARILASICFIIFINFIFLLYFNKIIFNLNNKFFVLFLVRVDFKF